MLTKLRIFEHKQHLYIIQLKENILQLLCDIFMMWSINKSSPLLGHWVFQYWTPGANFWRRCNAIFSVWSSTPAKQRLNHPGSGHEQEEDPGVKCTPISSETYLQSLISSSWLLDLRQCPRKIQQKRPPELFANLIPTASKAVTTFRCLWVIRQWFLARNVFIKLSSASNGARIPCVCEDVPQNRVNLLAAAITCMFQEYKTPTWKPTTPKSLESP